MTKVLVVDDTPDMAELMRRACADQGHRVFVAPDGYEAMKIARSESPDVILLDVMMPHMSGMEVLRELKRDPGLRTIPVILVTAKGEDEDVIAGLDEGAHDYVTKPFKAQILAARIRAAAGIKKDHDRLTHLNRQLQAEITQRERIQDELAQAHKLEAIGHLAAGIAHEINTPTQYVGDNIRFLQESFLGLREVFSELATLKGSMENHDLAPRVAEIEAALEEADAEYLFQEIPKAIVQALEGIDQVANIVRSMKEFSHPGNLEKRAVDLNQTIRNALTVSRNEWKYVAELVTDFDTALPLVSCLPGDLNQVILNLVVNAAQAMADTAGTGMGTLTVRTRRDGDWAEIRVEDTGCGIPEHVRNNVFDPFFTTKEVGRGTGQGLTIAYAVVVNKHGGTIAFDSEVGRGTVFIVRLPISDSAGSVEAEETQAALCSCDA
ncbi:MAG: response regulator [Pirellulaceae bacterium]|nr:response regulator [Pirellulaceae bacterium]